MGNATVVVAPATVVTVLPSAEVLADVVTDAASFLSSEQLAATNAKTATAATAARNGR
ncbi:MAG TPA: hypothetical protein PLV13_03085 [Ilumatobacteraceae bacterium]|nr:hypothetical protein [Ilumatobacteraceae bacterium]